MFLVLWVIGYVTVNVYVCMHSLTVFKEQQPDCGFWGFQQAVFMVDWVKCHNLKQNEAQSTHPESTHRGDN